MEYKLFEEFITPKLFKDLESSKVVALLNHFS